MIDDATSERTARFVRHDSTKENMRLLWSYLERHGRPVGFYTDKVSLFRTAPKRPRNRPGEEVDVAEMPPTQIGRALRELSIVWTAAHSPQAKGRVERSFLTAQDRLVKGLRVAGARTLEQANRYLDEEFVPWWNQHLRVFPVIIPRQVQISLMAGQLQLLPVVERLGEPSVGRSVALLPGSHSATDALNSCYR